jgi:hypothetical protein
MTLKHTQEKLDKSGLGVTPNPLKLARALIRPDQPFVMINMLVYKEKASGDYARLSGEEAYELYAKSGQKSLAHLGSRLLWSGHIHQKMTVGNAPSFHTIGLLEYASPKAFLQYITKGDSNSKARTAGLHGQWLIASTTLKESQLHETASDRHVVLVELWGGMRRNSEARRRWEEVRQSTYQAVGAKTIWYGHCDLHIIGIAAPGIENLIATWFPDTYALEQVMGDPQRDVHLQSLLPYLAYTASSMSGFLPELS